MLVAKEFGISPPAAAAAAPRRRMARVAPCGGSSPVGELWLRTRGGGGGAAAAEGVGSHGSHESEMDLAMLVSDFLENGGGGGAGAGDSRGSSDSENGLSDLAHLADKISVRIFTYLPYFAPVDVLMQLVEFVQHWTGITPVRRLLT